MSDVTTTVHLADLRTRLAGSDPGSPRITWYVLDGGSSDGERVELSGAVLANWAAKIANLLVEELDVETGDRVRLDLPPHWRTLCWAVGAWSAGCEVVTSGPAEVVATTAPTGTQEAARLVVVTLPALARSATVPVPAGAVDEARELATFGDRFEAWERPAGGAPALSGPGQPEPLTFAVDVPTGRSTRRLDPVDGTTPTAAWLGEAARTLAAGGSLVTTRVADLGAEDDRIAVVVAQERAEPRR